MTLQEIKAQLRTIETNVDKLRVDAEKLENPVIGDFISCELSYISYRISELAEVEEDSEGNADTDGLEEGLDDWWGDLDNASKSEVSGIPFPTFDDGGRGDNAFEFRDRADKWWNAKTISQRQEIYTEFSLTI